MIVGRHERRRRAGTSPGTLPCRNLQLSIRMLVRRMPEERGCLAHRRLTQSVDGISGNLEQCQRRRLRGVFWSTVQCR